MDNFANTVTKAFKEGVRQAIAETHNAGRPITVGGAGGVNKVYPDGTRIFIPNKDKFTRVEDINKATHWIPTEQPEEGLHVRMNRIYRILETTETEFEDDYESWICGDDGNLSMAFLCTSGDFFMVEGEVVPQMLDSTYFNMSKKERSKQFHVDMK